MSPRPAGWCALWRTLTSVKHDRTIVYTTHFLDEADLLADHIAILAAPGKLVASGSPVALKTNLGQGYNIQVTFDSVKLSERTLRTPRWGSWIASESLCHSVRYRAHLLAVLHTTSSPRAPSWWRRCSSYSTRRLGNIISRLLTCWEHLSRIFDGVRSPSPHSRPVRKVYAISRAYGGSTRPCKFSVNNRTQDVETTALWRYSGCFLLWFSQQPNTIIQRNSSNHALDAGLVLHRTLTSVIAHGEPGDVTVGFRCP